jgi:predicted ATPase
MPITKKGKEAAELSDGTLRYLALAGALLAYRLPAFVALPSRKPAFILTCWSRSRA